MWQLRTGRIWKLYIYQKEISGIAIIGGKSVFWMDVIGKLFGRMLQVRLQLIVETALSEFAKEEDVLI